MYLYNDVQYESNVCIIIEKEKMIKFIIFIFWEQNKIKDVVFEIFINLILRMDVMLEEFGL